MNRPLSGQEDGDEEVAAPPTGQGLAKSTSQDPNFVRNYFAQSRLHFIGSFRARYESMMVAVARRCNRSPQSLLRSSTHSPDTTGRHTIQKERTIVHVDMDCFFASVAKRDNPELRGKPIAVCHASVPGSTSVPTRGGGEISSCSYEARSFGVRAGMFFNKAKEICPELIAVSYDFGAYEQVSIIIYSLFYSIDPMVVVQASSIDEAYLDFTHSRVALVCAAKSSSPESTDNVDQVVSELRAAIFTQTGCRASAGIGPSKLLARLATSRAKPNGQLRVRASEACAFVLDVPLSELPGIGWRTGRKLKALGVTECRHLRSMSQSALKSQFGERLGKSFYDLCRGVDFTEVEPLKPRKSIGAEISWGVRFGLKEDDKVERFVRGVASEVANRCTSASALGSKVTVKVYKWRPDLDGPSKYLGHGPCDIITKSGRIRAQSSSELHANLPDECFRLLCMSDVRPTELRGFAVQVGDIVFPSLNVRDRTETGVSKFFVNRGSTEEAPPRTAHGAEKESSVSPTVHRDLDAAPPSQQPRALENSDDRSSPRRAAAHARTQDDWIGAFARKQGWDPVALKELPPDVLEELIASSGGNERPRVIADKTESEKEPHDVRGSAAIAVVSEDDAADQGRKRFRGEERDSPMPPFIDEVRPQNFHGAGIHKTAVAGNGRTSGSDSKTPHVVRDEPQVSADDGGSHRGPAYQAIPEVWDCEVFDALPSTLQGELLEHQRQHDANEEKRARTKRRRAQVTMTQLIPRSNRTAKCQGTDTVSDEKKNGKEADTRMSSKSDSESSDIHIPSPPVEPGSDNDGPRDEDCWRRSGLPGGVLSQLELRQAMQQRDSRIFQKESLASFAPKLRRWISESSEDVRSAHAELLRSHLLEKVERREISEVFAEVRTIRRFVAEVGSSDWVEAFNVILADIQNHIRSILEVPLAVRPLTQPNTPRGNAC